MEGTPKADLKTTLKDSSLEVLNNQQPLLYDCLIDCDKVIAREASEQGSHSTGRVINYHVKARTSEMNRLAILRQFPKIAQALEELPSPLALPRKMGVYMSPKFYKGIKRSGRTYLNRWLEENKIAISHTTMLILNAIAFYGEFTTYDDLLEYLRDQNCGGLEPDRQEEIITKKPEVKVVDPRDVEWLNSEERKKAIAQPTKVV